MRHCLRPVTWTRKSKLSSENAALRSIGLGSDNAYAHKL